MNSRRNFIRQCSTAVAGLALTPVLGISQTPATALRTCSTADMTVNTFSPLVGTDFIAKTTDGNTVPLKLVKVRNDGKSQAARPNRKSMDPEYEKFSLIFAGSARTQLDSAIYQFYHAKLGQFDMHIGAVGSKESHGVNYQAIFNKPQIFSIV